MLGVEPSIKVVPQDAGTRRAIRDACRHAANDLDRGLPPDREDLTRVAADVLGTLGLPKAHLGFAMVAVSNEFWRLQFAAIPPSRRLLLLPHCLRNQTVCHAPVDGAGLHCARCGSCNIAALQAHAEDLGYTVVVAEGTSAVVDRVLDGTADAILGVACLDSLEKSYERVANLGIPHMALPLLRDGCKDTEAEIDEIEHFLKLTAPSVGPRTRSYIPLLRLCNNLFEADRLSKLLPAQSTDATHHTGETHRIAIDWLRAGGKRFRPFITVAAYVAARHGGAALQPDADAEALVPRGVRELAVAIEAMHKASLAHDDIEDDDERRYGQETLHRKYGVGPAINVGDYLIGMGYRLVADQAASLGPDCAADALAHLAWAHTELCSGQGADLLWKRQGLAGLAPRDALTIYARKTAPAFWAALAVGLRAAGFPAQHNDLERYCRYLGQGYQVWNDLDDWEPDDTGKLMVGRDVAERRPTILHAFAAESAPDRAAHVLGDPLQAQHLYTETGAFRRAEVLLTRLRERTLAEAGTASAPWQRDLLKLLAQIVLPYRSVTENP